MDASASHPRALYSAALAQMFGGQCWSAMWSADVVLTHVRVELAEELLNEKRGAGMLFGRDHGEVNARLDRGGIAGHLPHLVDPFLNDGRKVFDAALRAQADKVYIELLLLVAASSELAPKPLYVLVEACAGQKGDPVVAVNQLLCRRELDVEFARRRDGQEDDVHGGPRGREWSAQRTAARKEERGGKVARGPSAKGDEG